MYWITKQTYIKHILHWCHNIRYKCKLNKQSITKAGEVRVPIQVTIVIRYSIYAATIHQHSTIRSLLHLLDSVFINTQRYTHTNSKQY